MVRFGVLGPVAAWDGTGRALDLGTGRAATLLGLLLLAEGPVPAERLADRLWSGEPPPSAATTLQGWISRLRRELEPGVPASAARVLLTRGGGYEVAADGLDLRDFRAESARMAAALAAGDAGTAASAGERALGLWRGPDPFGGLLDDAAPAEVAAVREERLAVTEQLLRVRLDRGEHAALLGPAAAYTAEHPLREDAWAVRVLALYRGDRQAEALAAARTARRHLRDELGLDPGATLRAVEAAVLAQDHPARHPGWWPDARADRAPPSDNRARERTEVHHRRRRGEDFVGRGRELRALEAVVRSVAGAGPAQPGGLAAVVVTGPAGVGKSRLLREALAGTDAVWIGCAPDAEAPGHDVWRRLLAVLGTPPAEDPPGARAWAGAVAEALATRPAPAVVVVDDLQWADAAALRALALLPAETTVPVLLAVTARDERTGDDPALAAALAALDRCPGERLAVEPLGTDEVAAFVRRGVPAAPAALARRVAERSGGNAFFMTELVRLAAGGRSADELPDRVVDAVGAHVAGLGEHARTLLRAAAVLGDGAVLDTVGEVAGVPADRLDAAVDAAVGSGLLADDPVHVRFEHALVRESLVTRVTGRTAAGLHRAYARARVTAGENEAALAGHLAAGRDPAAPAACLAAGETAIASAAFEAAVGWARRGLELAGEHGGEAGRLRLLEGTGLRRAGRIEQAGAVLRRCWDDATEHGDDELAARAALELAGGAVTGYWSIAAGTAPGAVDRLAAARARPGLSTATAAALDAALAVRLGVDGRLREAREHLDAVRAAPADAAPPAARLLAEFVVRWRPGLAAERLDLLDRLGPGAGTDLAARLGVLQLRALTLLELGRLEESDAMAARLAELARRHRYDDFLLLSRHWAAMRSSMAGRLDEAVRTAQEAFSPLLTGSVETDRVLRASVETALGIAAWERRELPLLLPAWEEQGAPTEHAGWAVVAALGLAQAGRVAESAEVVRRAVGPGPQELDDGGFDGTATLVLLTEWAWEVRDRSWAKALLPRLEALADAVVVLGAGGACMGPGRLWTGTAAALAGHRDRARADLESAVRRCEELGMPLFAARARARLADAG